MTNYYQLVQLFNNLCLAHPNVERFTSDEVEVFDASKSTQWPLAHLVVNDMTINEGRIRYNVTLLVADKLAQITENSEGANNALLKDFRGTENTLDVINSCQGVVADVFAYIVRNPTAANFTIELDTTMTPFIEKGQNAVAGVSAQFFVDASFDVNACLFDLTPVVGNGGDDTCCQ